MTSNQKKYPTYNNFLDMKSQVHNKYTSKKSPQIIQIQKQDYENSIANDRHQIKHNMQKIHKRKIPIANPLHPFIRLFFCLIFLILFVNFLADIKKQIDKRIQEKYAEKLQCSIKYGENKCKDKENMLQALQHKCQYLAKCANMIPENEVKQFHVIIYSIMMIVKNAFLIFGQIIVELRKHFQKQSLEQNKGMVMSFIIVTILIGLFCIVLIERCFFKPKEYLQEEYYQIVENSASKGQKKIR